MGSSVLGTFTKQLWTCWHSIPTCSSPTSILVHGHASRTPIRPIPTSAVSVIFPCPGTEYSAWRLASQLLIFTLTLPHEPMKIRDGMPLSRSPSRYRLNLSISYSVDPRDTSDFDWQLPGGY